ncbi:DUF6318 family protein [Nocardioides zeae]|uniref:DUF6318 family protein n=1 Tax=Nocardioides imazamoxiresistens TaxID=3231893 RepID=A0ABU3PXU4_9ACTN|nr:DUF6318 family protein [Nocardioides zeae]MDT9593984.1 DUF6318 family protein [Nocardioides zeae]
MAALVALAVAGCTGGSGSDDDADDPSTSSETSTSAGPTDDASETAVEPPELPAEAQEQTEAGGDAFARFYVDVMNYSQATGDAAPLETYSTDACSVCDGYEEATAEGYADGGHLEGGTFTIRESSVLPADYGADFGIYLVLDVADLVVHFGDGSERRDAGQEYRIGMYPVWTDGGWLINTIAVPTS